jgi:sporulation protein YlmC with PRC-barrel domain
MIKRLLASTALALVLTLPALAQTSTTTTTDTQNQTTTVPSASQSGTSTDTSQSATQSGQSTTGSTAQPSTTGGATTGSTTAQTGESSGSSSSMSSSTGQTAAGEEAIISQQQPGQVRADKVIGAKVTNPEEEKVGDVSDILLDEQGKVVGVILSVGGFLGIGDKHVAVNWNDIKLEDDGEKVVVNMTKDQITKAPSFKTAEDIKSEQQAQMPASSTSGTSIPSTTGTSTTGTSTTGTSTTQ